LPRLRRSPVPHPSGAAACRLCGEPTRPFLSAIDRNQRVSDERFDYHRCPRCGLVTLVNPPADLGRFYPSGYYRAPHRWRLAWAAWRERYQVELVGRYTAADGRLVEIGSAWGTFAYGARRAGFGVTAIERDGASCAFLSAVAGVEAIQSTDPAEVLSRLPPSRAVVMWQVAEHLEDPWAVLDRAAGNLEPGGVLVVGTPNPGSLGLRLLGARWPHLDAPRHLWLIPPDVLDGFLGQRGMHRVLLTTDDPGGRRWNRFAWGRALPAALPPRVAGAAGALVALVMRPLERRPGRGSCYTAVYRRGPAAEAAS
jgi:hypothetical protein